MKKIGFSYKLQFSLLEQEMEHHGVFEYTWGNSENEWLPYVKSDVLSTAFCYDRYIMGMEELTGFIMKNSISLPSISNNYFERLGDENDELSYTYTDPFMRIFVRISIKSGRCIVFSQHHKFEIIDEVFNFMSKKMKR